MRPFRPRGPFARAVMPTRPLMPVCAMRHQTEKIVVEAGISLPLVFREVDLADGSGAVPVQLM